MSLFEIISKHLLDIISINNKGSKNYQRDILLERRLCLWQARSVYSTKKLKNELLRILLNTS